MRSGLTNTFSIEPNTIAIVSSDNGNRVPKELKNKISYTFFKTKVLGVVTGLEPEETEL